MEEELGGGRGGAEYKLTRRIVWRPRIHEVQCTSDVLPPPLAGEDDPVVIVQNASIRIDHGGVRIDPLHMNLLPLSPFSPLLLLNELLGLGERDPLENSGFRKSRSGRFRAGILREEHRIRARMPYRRFVEDWIDRGRGQEREGGVVAYNVQDGRVVDVEGLRL